MKNAQKFQKASQRAKQAGILKNAVNYGKAAVRQIAKAELPQKVIKGVTKGIKNALKVFSTNNADNTEINNIGKYIPFPSYKWYYFFIIFQ